jgi:predicted transcriptional regulator
MIFAELFLHPEFSERGEKMLDFEKQVRHALIDHDMSMTELAEQLEISVSYLYDIITGARKAEHQKQRIRQLLSIEGGEDDEEQIVSQ